MLEEIRPESASSSSERPADDTPAAAAPASNSQMATAAGEASAIFRKPAAPSGIPVRPVALQREEPESTTEGFRVQPLDAVLVIAALAVVAMLGYVYMGRQASSGPPAPRSIVAARSGGAPVPARPAALPPTAGSDQSQGAAPATANAPGQAAAMVSPPQAQETTPQLHLVGLQCRREDGSNVIEGVVRNATAEPLPQVFVVGTWGAADGQVVKTDDAPVKDDPIPPRQTTSFRVSIPERSEVTFCQVAFRTFGGGPIPWMDARQR